MRRDGTKAEALLWIELKARRLGGHHFVRQLPIGPYIADFACRRRNLVVEIDGSQHADNSYDRKRDTFLNKQGYSVIRFWNDDVIRRRRSVCETILAALDGRLTESTEAFDLRYRHAKLRETASAAEQLTPDQRVRQMRNHETTSPNRDITT